MVLLRNNTIEFAFPEVHPEAVLKVDFCRTLRVPDDGQRHYLPPNLGRFVLRSVSTLDPARLPRTCRRRGGMVMPMWQAEACWLRFRSPNGYPFLVKVAAGAINAVNGAPWREEPDFADQDYFEVPNQPWLDGFRVNAETVRQFVAMPLGRGYTAEEQLTGKAGSGGVRLLVHPLKGTVWQERRDQEDLEKAIARELFGLRDEEIAEEAILPMLRNHQKRSILETLLSEFPRALTRGIAAKMLRGLGAGGVIRQSIERAVEKREDWDLSARGRCFIHLVNSAVWRQLTGEEPPTPPPTAADYTRAGLPWFVWYAETPLEDLPERPTALQRLRSVLTVARERGETALPENEGFPLPPPIRLGRRRRAEAG